MNRDVRRVWAYRARATFGLRWRAYLSLVLLIGLVGGVAMGALAAARRTQSSYEVYLASTNPSNLSVGTALYAPALGFRTGYDGPLVRKISHLPHVRRAESYASMYIVPVRTDGQPTTAAFKANFTVYGSVDGEFFNQDRATVVQGRMADPGKANEIVMSVGAAHALGLHVGQTVEWGAYANSQPSSGGGPSGQPFLRRRLTLVGTVVLNNASCRTTSTPVRPPRSSPLPL